MTPDQEVEAALVPQFHSRIRGECPYSGGIEGGPHRGIKNPWCPVCYPEKAEEFGEL